VDYTLSHRIHFCCCQFMGGDVDGGCDVVNAREAKALKHLKNPPVARVWTRGRWDGGRCIEKPEKSTSDSRLDVSGGWWW